MSADLKTKLTIALTGMDYRNPEDNGDVPVPEPPHPKKK